MELSGLEGTRVKLVPLREEHAQELYACGSDQAIWEHYPLSIGSIEDARRFVHKALEGRARGDQAPFVVYDKQTGRAVGSTRFLRIAPEHRNLNIGSTWYNPQVWRTSVNTECKALLLGYAFDVWGASRVELITTTGNERSQRAIERLGAVREGVLRQKYNGMDYVFYSIVSGEWPQVKLRLARLLAGEGASRP